MNTKESGLVVREFLKSKKESAGKNIACNLTRKPLLRKYGHLLKLSKKEN